MMVTPVLLIFGLILIVGLIGLVVLLGVAMNHPSFRAVSLAILGLMLLLGLPLLLAAAGWLMFSRRAVEMQEHQIKTVEEARMEMEAVERNNRRRQPAEHTTTATNSRGQPADEAAVDVERGDVPAWVTRTDTRWTDDGAYFTRIDLGPVLREDYPELPEGPLPAVLEREQFQRLLRAHGPQRAAFEKKVSLALREFARRASSHRVKHVPFSLSEAIDKLVSEVMVTEVRLTDTILLEGDTAEPSPTVAVHALLKIDQPTRQEILARAERSVSRERMAVLALLGVMLLSLMGIALAFLKLDIRNQGRYRGRLALATVVAILVLLFGGALLMMA